MQSLRPTPALLNNNLCFNKIPCGSVAWWIPRSPTLDDLQSLIMNLREVKGLPLVLEDSGCSLFYNSVQSYLHKPAQTLPLLSSVPWTGWGTFWSKGSGCGLGTEPWPGEELAGVLFFWVVSTFLHVPASPCPWGDPSACCSFIAFKIYFIFHYVIPLSSLSFSCSTCSILI